MFDTCSPFSCNEIEVVTTPSPFVKGRPASSSPSATPVTNVLPTGESVGRSRGVDDNESDSFPQNLIIVVAFFVGGAIVVSVLVAAMVLKSKRDPSNENNDNNEKMKPNKPVATDAFAPSVSVPATADTSMSGASNSIGNTVANNNFMASHNEMHAVSSPNPAVSATIEQEIAVPPSNHNGGVPAAAVPSMQSHNSSVSSNFQNSNNGNNTVGDYRAMALPMYKDQTRSNGNPESNTIFAIAVSMNGSFDGDGSVGTETSAQRRDRLEP